MIGLIDLINNSVYNKRVHNDISTFDTFDKKLAIHRTNTRLDQSIQGYNFSDLFVELLDEAIVLNDISLLSKDQKKFIDRYLTEAETTLTSEDLIAFDIYLANYTTEEING